MSSDFLKNVELESATLFDSEPVWFTNDAFVALIGEAHGELCLALWAYQPSCICEVQIQQILGLRGATPAVIHGHLQLQNHFASMHLPSAWKGKEKSDLSVTVRQS